MALSPQALVKGLVSRLLSPPNSDGYNNDVAFRQDTYGGVFTQPRVRKSHVLADEGSYFVANNGSTAVNANIGTAFSATLASVLIQNLSLTQRLFLDYIARNVVVGTTQASGASFTAYALVLDTIQRYSSAGTQITPLSPSMERPNPTGIAAIYTGPVVTAAAGAAARTVIGQRNMRPASSATVITLAGDMIFLNFGGVEQYESGSITVLNPSIIPHACPPVVLGPNQSLLLHTWQQGSTTPAGPGTDIWEVGFWMS
jgi:hypothetical protein